jgi:hypothetical protein
MRRPITGAELLDYADEVLAGLDPAQSHAIRLRRATSAAYYALFHELVCEAVRQSIGGDPAREADRHSVSRWYTHTDIRTVSRWVLARAQNRTIPDPVAPLLDSPPPDLVAVADALLALQDARHDADYNHDANITPDDTLAAITRARDALARLPSLAGDRAFTNYLLLLLGGPRITSR